VVRLLVRALWLTVVAVALLLAGGIFLAEFGWLDPLRPAALQRPVPNIDTSALEDHLSRTHAARTGRHDDLEQAAQGVASSSLSGNDLQASLDQLFRTIDKEKAMTDQEHQHTKEILARLGSNQ